MPGWGWGGGVCNAADAYVDDDRVRPSRMQIPFRCCIRVQLGFRDNTCLKAQLRTIHRATTPQSIVRSATYYIEKT